MGYEILVIIGLLEGIFTGILLRFEITSRIPWLLNLVSMIGLFVLVMPLFSNPSVNGFNTLMSIVMPYILTAAFSYRGEALIGALFSR